MAEPVRQVLNFRYRTGINFSNLRTEDCSPKNPKSRRNGFEKRLPEKPASDFLGRSSRSLQMHRSRRSLKDRGGEQDAPLGRPNAPLKQTVLTVLSVLTVYPELTPGKQYVTFKAKVLNSKNIISCVLVCFRKCCFVSLDVTSWRGTVLMGKKKAIVLKIHYVMF